MKKVTTNITLGQILFILFTFFMASFIFFYLGAKFGPNILGLPEANTDEGSLLPDEKLALEIKTLLDAKKHDFIFDTELSGKPHTPATKPVVASKIIAAKADGTSSPKQDDKPKTVTIDDIKVKIGEPKVISTTMLPHTPQPDTLVDEQPATQPQAVYSLQLGSFSDKKAAQKALALWRDRGYEAQVVSYPIAGKGQWYRLEIGGYAAESEALATQQTIMNKFKQSVRVVLKP